MQHSGDEPEQSGQSGVLIMRGMRPVIPAGGLQITMNEDGSLNGGLTLHLAMDMTPHWIRLAFENLRSCESASAELRSVWKDGSTPEEADALEREFRAGMQACAASAFAIDAFYASVQDAAPIDSATAAAWKKNRIARHSQISETLRMRFQMSQAKFQELAAFLKSLFELRDEAVHPKAGPQETVFHPTIKVTVER